MLDTRAFARYRLTILVADRSRYATTEVRSAETSLTDDVLSRMNVEPEFEKSPTMMFARKPHVILAGRDKPGSSKESESRK